MKYRTHSCGELSLNHEGQHVKLSGWIHRYRDHGGVIFIDLRDRFGVTQIVCRSEENSDLLRNMSELRSEWVISVEGIVCRRSLGMENNKISTGDIEVNINYLKVLSKSKVPPFSICDEQIHVNEDLRLRYRYLDMRRGDLLNNLLIRHQIVLCVRNFLNSQGFIEVVTPVLGKSTPEGARDYLVPSRIYPGQFYALPQSPQLFKQLLMIGGVDKYFQIATCFRDEDLRADRQPEFSQIDIELSFNDSNFLFELVENLIKSIFDLMKFNINIPFQKMTYDFAMENYGTDKPDLRFDLLLKNCSEIAKKFTFSVFLDQIANGGIVKGFKIPQGADISRKKIDEYTNFVKNFGAEGLVWLRWQNNELSSNVTKFATVEVFEEIKQLFEVNDGDAVFLIASQVKIVHQALDNLRRLVAKERQLYSNNDHRFVWITEFPLFNLNEDEIVSEHHPFTAPYENDLDLLDSDPLKVRSSSYDLVLNGFEIASGSERIYDNLLQKRIFSILGLSDVDIKEKFGFFVEALQYGTPPHLGIALGLDRLIMILTKTASIRDIIAFPKTQKAADIMTGAPDVVLEQQLKDLSINVRNI